MSVEVKRLQASGFTTHWGNGSENDEIKILCLFYSLLILQSRDLHALPVSHDLSSVADPSACRLTLSLVFFHLLFGLSEWGEVWEERRGWGEGGWDSPGQRSVRRGRRLTVWSFFNVRTGSSRFEMPHPKQSDRDDSIEGYRPARKPSQHWCRCTVSKRVSSKYYWSMLKSNNVLSYIHLSIQIFSLAKTEWLWKERTVCSLNSKPKDLCFVHEEKNKYILKLLMRFNTTRIQSKLILLDFFIDSN